MEWGAPAAELYNLTPSMRNIPEKTVATREALNEPGKASTNQPTEMVAESEAGTAENLCI